MKSSPTSTVMTQVERTTMAFTADMIDGKMQDFARSIAKQKDDIILSAIKDFLKTEDVDIRELAGRCSVVVEGHLKKETYLIDGKPFMELLDPVFENVKDEHNQFIYRQTQNYRRLF